MAIQSMLPDAALSLAVNSPNANFVSRDPLENTRDLTEEVTSKYDWAGITQERWSQYFPYQLAVLEVRKDGGYSIYKNTVFTLPISPEDLQVSTPFASNLSATLNGVVRQSGGAPFRSINCSGTFGVLLNRPTGEHLGERWTNQLGDLGGIVGGTIGAASRTVTAAQSIVKPPEFTPNILQDDDVDLKGTGYYQFRQLQRFLESYAEITKISKGSNLRLAFLMWKDEAGYIVEPTVFTVSRNAGSPHEYRYQLQFQAWRRIDPGSLGVMGPKAQAPTGRQRTQLLQKAFRTLDGARKTLQEVRSTVLAIRGDFDVTVGELLRQSILLLKDSVGLAKTVTDLPKSLRADVSKTAKQWWDGVKANTDNLTQIQQKILNDITSRIEADKNGSKSANLSDPYGLSKYLSDGSNAWLTDAIDLDGVPLTGPTADAINEDVEAARKLTRKDFLDRANTVRAMIGDYSDRIGLGNASYNRTYGLSTGTKVRDATDDDYVVLNALSEMVRGFNVLATYADTYKPKPLTTIEYIAGAANAAGIAMRVPRSKFAVPFGYGDTLELLAQRYLGDSERWHEIAALNDLRSPYVDEVGSEQAILVPGRKNELVVADAQRMIVRQQITIYNPTDMAVSPDKRRIIGIKKVAPQYWVIALDGEANLGQYKPTDGVVVHSFDPYTVHSQQLVYLPSDNAPSLEDNGQYVPTQTDVERLLEVGYVDGALSNTGDILIGADGDWRLTWGLASIIQWTRTCLSIPQGSLALHTGFGFPAMAGKSIADVSAKDVLSSLQAMFSSADAFAGIRSAAVEQTGPAIKVDLELEVRGSEALIPLTFDVAR